MPISSNSDLDAEQRQATRLAGFGTTASLAAAAAARLQGDPTSDLSPRLRAALQAVTETIERASTVKLPDIAHGEVPAPESLVAALAAHEQPQDQPLLKQVLGELLKDLRSLTESPTSDAAARVAAFLSDLSVTENQLAHRSLNALTDSSNQALTQLSA